MNSKLKVRELLLVSCQLLAMFFCPCHDKHMLPYRPCQSAQACYQAVHGHGLSSTARLFFDFGAELTSFDSIDGNEELCLVVTDGEVSPLDVAMCASPGGLSVC
jgi:hypothetical protein